MHTQKPLVKVRRYGLKCATAEPPMDTTACHHQRKCVRARKDIEQIPIPGDAVAADVYFIWERVRLAYGSTVLGCRLAQHTHTHTQCVHY